MMKSTLAICLVVFSTFQVGAALDLHVPFFKRVNENYCRTGEEPLDALKVKFTIWDTAKGLVNLDPTLNHLRTVKLDTLKETAATCVQPASATQSATYFGFRREIPKDNDHAVVLIYDINGVIAGIQTRIPLSATKHPENKYRYGDVPMFQTETVDDVDYYVLTAYFIKPSEICSTGRTKEQIANQLVVELNFQNGTSPDQLVLGPKKRADALANGYADNNCFLGMGKHTFHGGAKVWIKDDCETIFPVFLLYSCKDSLIGMGLDWTGTHSSARHEEPPAFAIKQIVGDDAPKCLLDGAAKGGPGAATMHVYFVDRVPMQAGCTVECELEKKLCAKYN